MQLGKLEITIEPAGLAALREALDAASQSLNRHALLTGSLPPRAPARARPIVPYTPAHPLQGYSGRLFGIGDTSAPIEPFPAAVGLLSAGRLDERFALARSLVSTPSRRSRRLARRARKRKLRKRA